MKIKGVSKIDLYSILKETNKKYAGNIQFNYDPYWIGKYLNFTLRVIHSKNPGHRILLSGRRWISACWHVHRDFMIILFENFGEATLKTCTIVYYGVEDFYNHYHFSDTNIGSDYNLFQYSKACECRPNLDIITRKCTAKLKNIDWKLI